MILSTEQIRVLNDARTILDQLDKSCGTHRTNPEGAADGYDYGRVAATAGDAAAGIFHTLNVLNAYRVQTIPEDLMHNREPDMTRSLGQAETITVESDEYGFELHLDTDGGRYVINIHAVAEQLLDQCAPIEAWLEEGRAAAAEHQRDIDGASADGYAPDDPKNSHYHDTMSAVWDARADK